MAVLPLGEWRPDVSDLRKNYTRLLRNVLPRSDGYGPFKDIETFTGALPGPCRGYYVARKEDGSAFLFAGTSTNLYLLDNTTLAWSLVSKGGGYTALDADANWVFAQFNNFLIATQRNDDMQLFDISSDTAFDDLTGSPPQAGWVAVVGRFVVACDLLDDPFRVHWSGLNDVTEWSSGVNNSDYQDLPDNGRVYVVGEVSGDVGLIGQAGGWRRMVFAPGSEFVFQIDRLQAAPGILAPHSFVISAGSAHYLSLKGFAQIDANGGYIPIGEERVDRTFLGKHAASAPADVLALAYDDTAVGLIVGAADPASSTILWGYKSIGGATGLMDKGLAYHTTIKRWSPVELSGEYLAPVVRPGVTLESLDENVAAGALVITGTASGTSSRVRLTVSSTAALTTGMIRTVKGVTGTTEANGTWTLIVVDSTHLELTGSTYANAYVSGGLVCASVDLLSFSLDSLSSASLPNISVFDSTHSLGFFTGDILEAELHTAEQSIDEGYRIDINGLRPITDADSVFCSVIKRDNLNATDTEGDESEMDSDGNCPVLEETRYARAKIRIPEATDWTFMTGVEPDTNRSGLF
jgi:hypothetical protein